MPVEIERKYLVINNKWKIQVESEATLKQGYLATLPNASIRVRVAKGCAHLNIKSVTLGISRSEYEYEIPLEEGEEILANLTAGPIIDKVRYKVRCGNHIWDLDLFHGDNEGLIVAEVELDAEDETFEMPEWAGEEVSGDPKYYNASLVKRPYCDW
ncbi:MAG: CYTH domain-containing protein [gamma proteobacterium endosymbiont of Lamellibrachia anaximandri]|nr:CYTH domain-containing protein [gamma proteobacterium endosymbiont of Lamellibrachia anaximandri]MBL3532506.1 CYTH domain-containing protein [gamma proteobacterium endosymbiont of Lamellibrachia anaximandri]